MSPLASLILKDAEVVATEVNLSPLDAKSVLITGASGLVGTYLIASIRMCQEKMGISPTVYAVIQSDPLEYFRELLSFPNTKIIQGDLSDEEFVKTLPKADMIIHAAGYGQPGKFMEDQVKTLKLNVMSEFFLFEKLNPGGKFLFLSSSEVYSGLPNPPYREDQVGTTNTDHLRSCYIEAKRCGEAICNAYRAKNVAAKSARLSLAYGPGTKHGDARVLNAFIQKALSGNLNLLDQGRAKRTYCYITDAVEILWHILLYGKDPIYNVGGTSKTTIRELAEKIGTYLKVPVTFPAHSENAVQGAPEDVFLSMEKVAGEFGKKTFVPIESGLAKTIEWQKILYTSWQRK